MIRQKVHHLTAKICEWITLICGFQVEKMIDTTYTANMKSMMQVIF
jgi:hypothetical protein